MGLMDFFHRNFLVAGASFAVPVLGQILCGRLKRGIMLLIPNFVTNLVRQLFSIYRDIFRAQGQFVNPYLWSAIIQALYIISITVSLIVRIWATYDAYRIA